MSRFAGPKGKFSSFGSSKAACQVLHLKLASTCTTNMLCFVLPIPKNKSQLKFDFSVNTAEYIYKLNAVQGRNYLNITAMRRSASQPFLNFSSLPTEPLCNNQYNKIIIMVVGNQLGSVDHTN